MTAASHTERTSCFRE